ncbi:MAG: helix-turn-helix transcriptional regulator [Pirellulales bacterium]
MSTDGPKLQIWLFDTLAGRRQLWRSECNRHQISLQCFEAIQTFSTPSERPTLVVFDQSLVGDLAPFVDQAIRKCTDRFLVCTDRLITCDDAVRLVRLGVGWLFDDQCKSFPREFSTMLGHAEKWAKQWTRYRQLNGYYASLTDAENDVLNLLLEGTSNTKIASDLGVSVRTVESRKIRIYHKLQVQTVVALTKQSMEMESLRSTISRNSLTA